MNKFIFSTTGSNPLVKFEEIGAYFSHPISAYTLSDYFSLEEIRNSLTIQNHIDIGDIIAIDEYGNEIVDISYLGMFIPVFDVEEYTRYVTYIGYGVGDACKIQKITTTNNLSYDTEWADGEQTLNKIWANRYSYTYF